MSGSQQNQSPIARLVFKEITEGDRRKILAESNDADNGGGARDFRFGDYSKLSPMFERMFPNKVVEKRVRSGAKTDVTIRKGYVHWEEAGGLKSKELCFEPPTSARPSEGRITRVHEYPCFDVSNIPVAGAANRVVLILIQREDGTLWPYFADETSFRNDPWDPRVSEEILRCIHATRAAGRAVIGYIDFTTSEKYCNGK